MSNKILAIGPHPDDLEFGIGGLLIKEVESGASVKMLVCTRGEAGTNGTPEVREQESRSAAEMIGADIEFIDMGGDCHIEDTKENAFIFAREIRRFKPDIVLAPTLDTNQHPDHPRVGRLVQDAARFARYRGSEDLQGLDPHAIGSLYFYAITVNDNLDYDIIIDVSDQKKKWDAVMDCHESQLQTKAYKDMQQHRSRYLGITIGTEQAIGLWKNDPIRLDSLADLELSSRGF